MSDLNEELGRRFVALVVDTVEQRILEKLVKHPAMIDELGDMLRRIGAAEDRLSTQMSWIKNNERKISVLEAPALEERVRKLETDIASPYSIHAHPDTARRIAALEAKVIELSKRQEDIDEGYPAAVVGDIETHNQRLNAMANTYASLTERVMKLEDRIASVEAFNGRLNALENAEMSARDAIDWKGFRRLVSRVEATAKQSDDLGGRLAALDETVKDLVAMSNPHGPVVATGKLDDDITVTVHRVEVKDPDRWVAEMEKRLADAPLSTDRPKPSETMPMWQRRVITDAIDDVKFPPYATVYRSGEGPPPVMIGLDDFVPVTTTGKATVPREDYDHAIAKLEACTKEINRLQHDNMQRKEAISNHKRDKAAQAVRICEQQREIESLRNDLATMTQRYRDEESRVHEAHRESDGKYTRLLGRDGIEIAYAKMIEEDRKHSEDKAYLRRQVDEAKQDRDRALVAMHADLDAARAAREKLEAMELMRPLFDLARKYVTGTRSLKYAGPEVHPMFSTLCEMVEADDAYEKAMSSRADLANDDIPF